MSLLALLVALGGCGPSPGAPTSSPPANLPSSSPTPAAATAAPVKGYRVINVYPHDPRSFTEGLVFYNGSLFESSGLNGHSELRREDLESGEVLQRFRLSQAYFAEGLTAYQNELVQLTYQSQVGFIYNIDTFALEKLFSYEGEGWGLTTDGQRLIVSDGSSYLQFWDPHDLHLTGTVPVMDAGKPVESLNELEYVQGRVYANVWQTDRIAIINPAGGRVESWLDLTGLLSTTGFAGEVDVLNGIAYDAPGDRLFVTGKLWPYLFEIKILP